MLYELSLELFLQQIHFYNLLTIDSQPLFTFSDKIFNQLISLLASRYSPLFLKIALELQKYYFMVKFLFLYIQIVEQLFLLLIMFISLPYIIFIQLFWSRNLSSHETLPLQLLIFQKLLKAKKNHLLILFLRSFRTNFNCAIIIEKIAPLQTMNFLRQNSLHLLGDLLPQLGGIYSNRIVNYLSFYLSFSGNHKYYTPQLYSFKHLQKVFTDFPTDDRDKDNYQHLLVKSFLTMSYQNQLMDPMGTYRFMPDLYNLNGIQKKDIIQAILKIKCRNIRQNQPIIPSEKLISPQKRRNIYVNFQRKLPSSLQLEQIITYNPFYHIPNINKILIFQKDNNINLSLPKKLEDFCQQNSVKIKLLQKASLASVVEYLYSLGKSKLLIHQNINYQKDIYDMTVPNESKNEKQPKTKLNFRLMPDQILILGQRLPSESLAKPENKDKILQKMRKIMSLQDNQSLLDPVNRIAMSTIQVSYHLSRQLKTYLGIVQQIQKNYRFDDQTISRESKIGFSLKRFVNQKVYEFNRKQDINTPYTNPSRKEKQK